MAEGPGQGGLCHQIRQPSDAADIDVDAIARGEAEVVRRHDAGAAEKNGPVREAALLAEPLHQLLERPGHLAEAGRAFEHFALAALNDQPDADLSKWRH